MPDLVTAKRLVEEMLKTDGLTKGVHYNGLSVTREETVDIKKPLKVRLEGFDRWQMPPHKCGWPEEMSALGFNYLNFEWRHRPFSYTQS